MVATRKHGGVNKDTLHQPQNKNSLRETRDNTTYMVFEDEPAVKLYAKNVEVGTSANGNHRQDQVTMGRVHSPESINQQSISFVRIQLMHQWIHQSWIRAKSLLREAATAGCLLACEQLPVTWSRQHRHVVCSPPAQTFHLYKDEQKSTQHMHFPVERQKRLRFTHW